MHRIEGGHQAAGHCSAQVAGSTAETADHGEHATSGSFVAKGWSAGLAANSAATTVAGLDTSVITLSVLHRLPGWDLLHDMNRQHRFLLV